MNDKHTGKLENSSKIWKNAINDLFDILFALEKLSKFIKKFAIKK